MRQKILRKSSGYNMYEDWEEYLVIEEQKTGCFVLSISVHGIILDHETVPDEYIVSKGDEVDWVYEFPDEVHGEKVHSWDGYFLRSEELVLAGRDDDHVIVNNMDFRDVIPPWLTDPDNTFVGADASEILSEVKSFMSEEKRNCDARRK